MVRVPVLHVVKLRLGDHLGNGLPGTICCKDFPLACMCGDTGGGRDSEQCIYPSHKVLVTN